MNQLNFITFYTDKYESRHNILIESIKKHHPESKILTYKMEDGSGTYPKDILLKRWQIVLEVLKSNKPYYSNLVLLGADMELFAPMDYFKLLLCHSPYNMNYNILLTPHCLKPLPIDGHQPSLQQIHRVGQMNVDCVGMKNTRTTINAIEWLINQPSKDDLNNGLFYDQSWMSMMPCLFDGVHIVRDDRFNVAYWNIHQRNFRVKDGKYWTEDGPLVLMHYSGAVKGKPEIMSHYQDRYKTVDGDILKIYKEYDERI